MHLFLTLCVPNAAVLVQASSCTYKCPQVAGRQLTPQMFVSRQADAVHEAWTGVTGQMQRLYYENHPLCLGKVAEYI